MLEKLLLLIVVFFARIIFAAYCLIPYTLIAAIILASAIQVFGLPDSIRATVDALDGYACLLIGLLILLTAYLQSRGREDIDKKNPFQKYAGVIGWVNARIDKLIAWVGTLKYFTSPLSIVTDPGSCKIKGPEIRELIDSTLQTGDILLRGFDGYVDGALIGKTGDGQGLGTYFSHAAIYLGGIDDVNDKPIAARRLQIPDAAGSFQPATEAQKDAIRNSELYYQPGRQMVIHSMSKGVFVEDILTFLRCDYLAVIRVVGNQFQCDSNDIENEGNTRLIPEDALGAEALAIHQSLMKGNSVGRDDVIKAVRHSALGKIGSLYDFQFSDIKEQHVFSCSEFVYYCYKSIHCYIGLRPKDHAFMKCFLRRKTITPADVYDAAKEQDTMGARLEVVWLSEELEKIKKGH